MAGACMHARLLSHVLLHHAEALPPPAVMKCVLQVSHAYMPQALDVAKVQTCTTPSATSLQIRGRASSKKCLRTGLDSYLTA